MYPNGDVNFCFMEQYITALEKTVIKDVVEYKDRVIEETKKVVRGVSHSFTQSIYYNKKINFKGE